LRAGIAYDSVFRETDGAYFERLVGNAVGVIGADKTFVTVMDHEDEQQWQRSCRSRREPRGDDAQPGATVGDARLREERVADGEVLVDGE